MLSCVPSPVQFQSTPPRREVTEPLLHDLHLFAISIHTSPKGGDAVDVDKIVKRIDISIHTSPKGGDCP